MNTDGSCSGNGNEWDFLEGLWRRAPVETRVPETVRARVRRQEWRMRIAAACEWLVAGCFVALVAWRLTVDASAATAVWGFLVLWFTGWLLSFSVNNRRGLWLPAAESAREYLQLARRRLASRRRTLRMAWLAYAAQLAVLLIWEIAARLEFAPPMFDDRWPEGLIVLGLFSILLLAWTWTVRRRLARETLLFDALEEENANAM